MAAFLAIALLASPALACIGGFGSGGCGAAAPSCGASYAAPGAAYPRAPVGYASAPSGYAQPPVFAAPAPINSYAAPGGFAAPAGGYAAPGGFAAPAPGGFAAPAPGGYSAPAAGGYSAPAGGLAGSETQGPVAAGFGGAFADTGAQNGNFAQPPPAPPPHQAPQGPAYIEGGQHPQPVISPATGENVQVIQPTVVIPEGTYQPSVVNPAGPAAGDHVATGGQFVPEAHVGTEQHFVPEGHGEQTVHPGQGGVAPSFAQPRTTVTANRSPNQFEKTVEIIDSRTFVPAPSTHISHPEFRPVQSIPQRPVTPPVQIQVPGSSVSTVEISEPVIPPVEIQTESPIVIEAIPSVEVHTGKTAPHTSSLQHRPVHITVLTSSESNPELEEKISETNSNRIDQHSFKSEVDDIDTESASFLPTQQVGSHKPKVPTHTERIEETTELTRPIHESINPVYIPTVPSSQNRQPQIHVEPAPYFEGGEETHIAGGHEGAGPREHEYEITHPIQPHTGPIDIPHSSIPEGHNDNTHQFIPEGHIDNTHQFIPEGHIDNTHQFIPEGPITHPEEQHIDESHSISPQEPEQFIPETEEPGHVEPSQPFPTESEQFVPQTGTTNEETDEEYEPVQPAQPTGDSENKETITPYQPEQEHATEETEEEQPHQEEADGYENNAQEQPSQPHHEEPATAAPVPAPVATQAPQEVPAATENYDHEEQAGAEYEDAGSNYDDAQPEAEAVKEEKSEAPYRN